MTIIERLNGKSYDFDEAEIRTLDFLIESPSYEHSFQEVEFRMGAIDAGSWIRPRKITINFLALSKSIDTFSLLRDEIFGILSSQEPFWITEKRSTNKRWLVKVESPFSISQIRLFGKFSVDFIAFEGVAKSVKTTLQLEKQGIVNDDTWGFGMGLETVDDTELIYTHTGKTFKVFNAGNVPVHPFESYLKIEIKNVIGSSTNFSLINRTNNTRFIVNKAVTNSELWSIDGPVIKRNSLNGAKDTTKEFIELSAGWNNFEILGASSAEVSFDFKFIYL